jgi:hypothetical protein
MNFRNIALYLLFILTGCDKGEAVDPVVATNDPQQIGKTSVVLEATIKEAGSIRPIQYGFLWGTTGGLNIVTAKNKLDLGSTDATKTYSIRLDSLTANTTYFATAFTASPDYSKIYYGNEISFKTLP